MTKKKIAYCVTDPEELVPVSVAAYLLGPDFIPWLAQNLETKWRIHNFGWGDFDQSFLAPIDLVLGGP